MADMTRGRQRKAPEQPKIELPEVPVQIVD